MSRDLDVLTHLLLAIWSEDLYLSQIEEIVDYFGLDLVRKAEELLYSSTVFRLILN